MSKPICSIAGCDNTVRARGWCKMHYNTWYRTGDAMTPPAHQPNDVCRADGCDRVPRSVTAAMCEMHYYRLRRNNSLEAHGNDVGERNLHWTGDAVGYRALHTRIKRSRGRAAQHQCVDCGHRAEQWSYDHQCPNEKRATQGAYSTDLDRYQPRCRSCHKTFDLAHAITMGVGV